MASSAPLSTKLVRIGKSLLVVGLASIGLTLWVTWQLEGGAAAVNEAGRMRMQTWRLTSAVQADEPRSRIDVLVAEFDTSLALLRDGDPGRPLFLPDDPAVAERFEQVNGLWQQQRDLWAGDETWALQEAMAAAEAFVAAIDRLVLAIEQQLSRMTAVLNLFQLVAVDKAPDEIASFASLVDEAAGYDTDWRFVMAAAMSGQNGRAPSDEAVAKALERMVEDVHRGRLDAFLPFDRQGLPVRIG